MNLSDHFYRSLRTLVYAVLLSSGLSGCNASKPPVSVAVPQTPEVEEPVIYRALNPSVIYWVLTAEIAQQRGDIYSASDLYSRAAQLDDSVNLAKHATILANLTRDPNRMNAALTHWQTIAPEDPDLPFLSIPFHLLQNDPAAIIQAADKAIALSPDRRDAILARLTDNLGSVLPQQQALSILSQLESYQAHDPEARYQYARLAAHYQLDEVAADTLATLHQEKRLHQAGLVLYTKVLHRQQHTQRALALLKKASQKKDASRSLRFAYGQLLGETNQLSLARTVFQSLHTENPDQPDVLFALGIISLDQQQYDAARRYFMTLQQLGDPANQAAYFLGVTEKEAGNYTEAMTWFMEVKDHHSRYQDAQTHYISLLADHGAFAKARHHLSLLRQKWPEKAIDYYLYETALLIDRGYFNQAMTLLNQAVTAHPEHTELRYTRALTAEKVDNIALLEQDIRHILAREPNNHAALNALGYTLTDKTDRHQEAMILIQKALALAPNDPFYLDSLGWVYYRLGELEKAEQLLRQAVQQRDDPELLAHLGEVLWQNDKKQAAKTIWQQGLKSFPDNELLNNTIQRFGIE